MEYLSTEIKSAREAMTIFKILGIKDVTTDRQRNNGTTVLRITNTPNVANTNTKTFTFCYI